MNSGGKPEQSSELVTLAVGGLSPDAWSNLQNKIFGLIDVLTGRIMSKLDAQPETSADTKALVQDVAAIAAEWARAKIERPSLENAQIRADITLKYAEAKKNLAEADKLTAEKDGILIDNELKQLRGMLEYLERTLDLMQKAKHANLSFTRAGVDGHLVIGPAADKLKLASDSAPGHTAT